MAGNDEDGDAVKPTEQRGESVPEKDEPREKGLWAAKARDGVVPAELGGSDAPADLLPGDPELGSSVLGRPARSQDPASETGVDPHGGDHADATTARTPLVDPEVDVESATRAGEHQEPTSRRRPPRGE